MNAVDAARVALIGLGVATLMLSIHQVRISEADPCRLADDSSSMALRLLANARSEDGRSIMNIDQVNGRPTGGSRPIAAPKNSSISIDGWAADPGGKASSGAVLLLVDGDEKFPILARPCVPRSDVAAHFHEPQLEAAGFSGKLDTGDFSDISVHSIDALVFDASRSHYRRVHGVRITTDPAIHVAAPIPAYVVAIDQVDSVPSKQGEVHVAPKADLTLSGWAATALAADPTTTFVTAELDGKQLGASAYGLERPDVAAYFKRPSFLRSGFSSRLPLGDVRPGHHRLTVHSVRKNDGALEGTASVDIFIEHAP